MSFLAKLFGRSSEPAAPAAPVATAEIEYKGFTIRAMPFKEQGQFQTSGEIEKVVHGTLRKHRFIRADRTPTQDEASELALTKARLMIDQMGEALFPAE